jgi:hypothetical protein
MSITIKSGLINLIEMEKYIQQIIEGPAKLRVVSHNVKLTKD